MVQEQRQILSTLYLKQNEYPGAMRRIAKYIINNPKQATGLTITQLALFADVGEATIVRLAKSLGFAGLQEFRQALTIEVSTMQRGDLNTTATDIKEKDDTSLIGKKVKNAVDRAVAETYDLFDVFKAEVVVSKMYNARRILIVGMGTSDLAAQYLKNKLLRIGRNAQCEQNTYLMYTACSLLNENDVIIVLSQKRIRPETQKAMYLAKKARAFTVLITDDIGSDLAKSADSVFFSGTHASYLQSDSLASITAEMYTCELFYIMLAKIDPQNAIRIKEMTESALTLSPHKSRE